MKKSLLILCLLTGIVQGNVYAEPKSEGILDVTDKASPQKIIDSFVVITEAELALLVMESVICEGEKSQNNSAVAKNLTEYRKFIKGEKNPVKFFEDKFLYPYAGREERSLWEELKIKPGEVVKQQEYCKNVVTSLGKKIWENIDWAYNSIDWNDVGQYVGTLYNGTEFATGTLINFDGMESELEGRVVLTAGSNYMNLPGEYDKTIINDKCSDSIQLIGNAKTLVETPKLREAFTPYQSHMFFAINGESYRIVKVYARTDIDVAIFILDRPVLKSETPVCGADINTEDLQPKDPRTVFTVGSGNNFWCYSKRATLKSGVKIGNNKIITDVDDKDHRSLSCSYGDTGSPIIDATNDAKRKIIGVFTKNNRNSEYLDNSLIKWIGAVLDNANDIKIQKRNLGPIAMQMIKEGFNELSYVNGWLNATFLFVNNLYNTLLLETEKLYCKDNNYTELGERLRPVANESDSPYDIFSKIAEEELGKWSGEFINRMSLLLNGNCGFLANYFIFRNKAICECNIGQEKSSGIIESTYPTQDALMNKISETLWSDENKCMVFRFDIAGHSFIGIKKDGRIEILQAWQEEYRIQDWLRKGDNYFTLEEFKTKLQKITSNLEEANDFFGIDPEKRLLSSTVQIKSFCFKSFKNECDLKFDFTTTNFEDKIFIPEEVYKFVEEVGTGEKK